MRRFRLVLVPFAVACTSVQSVPTERDTGEGGSSVTSGTSNFAAGGSKVASSTKTDRGGSSASTTTPTNVGGTGASTTTSVNVGGTGATTTTSANVGGAGSSTPTTTTTGGSTATAGAAGSTSSWPVTSAMSRCGGFGLEASTEGDDSSESAVAPRQYCEAELVQWSCNQTNPGLKLRLTRQDFQCCASLRATLEPEGNAYRLTVSDQAKDQCDCMCTFDVDVQASAVPCKDTTLKFGTESFSLPLSQGKGELIVSEEPSHYCKPTPIGVWADTDAPAYQLGVAGTARLHNDTDATVYLPGCVAHTIQQFDGTTWIPSNVGGVMCAWEGLARPVPAGSIFDTARDDVGGGFKPPLGTWRACFDVGYGCLPDQPMSKAKCTSNELICTPAFAVEN